MTKKNNKKRGTRITFKLNDNFFSDVDKLQIDDIIDRLRYTCYLVPNLKIHIKDETTGHNYDFSHTDGIKEMLEYNMKGDSIISNKTSYEKDGIFYAKCKGSYEDKYVDVASDTPTVRKRRNQIPIEVAFRFNSDDHSNIKSFANTIGTYQGGVHEEAFKKALADTFGKLANRYQNN